MAERDRETRTPTLWDPFGEYEGLGGWPLSRLVRHPRLMEGVWGSAGGFAPAVDVSENDDHYTVTAELPGISKDDVTVEMHDRTLTIRGEKRSVHEEKGEHRRHVERVFGSFSRSFTLPTNADADRISARFEEGVLTVEIQKAQATKPKTVDIKS